MTTTTKDDYRIKQQHILYGDMSDESLKELIKDTATMRKHPNAGGDLQEMRNEYRRRVADRFARRPKSTYNNNTMLEKPADVPKFKKTKFVTGMAPPGKILHGIYGNRRCRQSLPQCRIQSWKQQFGNYETSLRCSEQTEDQTTHNRYSTGSHQAHGMECRSGHGSIERSLRTCIGWW